MEIPKVLLGTQTHNTQYGGHRPLPRCKDGSQQQDLHMLPYPQWHGCHVCLEFEPELPSGGRKVGLNRELIHKGVICAAIFPVKFHLMLIL